MKIPIISAACTGPYFMRGVPRGTKLLSSCNLGICPAPEVNKRLTNGEIAVTLLMQTNERFTDIQTLDKDDPAPIVAMAMRMAFSKYLLMLEPHISELINSADNRNFTFSMSYHAGIDSLSEPLFAVMVSTDKFLTVDEKSISKKIVTKQTPQAGELLRTYGVSGLVYGPESLPVNSPCTVQVLPDCTAVFRNKLYDGISLPLEDEAIAEYIRENFSKTPEQPKN